jgi:hypothetical protein
MNVVCVLGSPRLTGNSASIAERFCQTARGLGATATTYALNKPIPRRNGLHHAESGWQPRIQAVAQPSGLCSGSHLPIRPDRSVPDGTYG